MGHRDTLPSCQFPGWLPGPLHIIVYFSVLLSFLFFIPESFLESLRIISANKCFIRGKLCIERVIWRTVSLFFEWLIRNHSENTFPQALSIYSNSQRTFKVLASKLLYHISLLWWPWRKGILRRKKEMSSWPPLDLQRLHLRNEL